MKYLILTLIASFVSCHAQTISLEAEAQCLKNPNCPDYTYAKDINNSLNKYVGTWKGSYNGKIYNFKFLKNIFVGDDIKSDLLIGRLKVTDSNGQTIYNTFNETDDEKTNFRGFYFQSNLQSYIAHFSGPGTSGCINRGNVYLNIDANDNTKMSVIFLADYDIVWEDCPSSFISTLPEKKRIFLIKQ